MLIFTLHSLNEEAGTRNVLMAAAHRYRPIGHPNPLHGAPSPKPHDPNRRYVLLGY
jgi:hypothetical protein